MKPLSILFLLVSSLAAQVKPTDAKVNMVFVGPFFTCSGSDGCPYLYRSAFQSWLNQCKKSPALDVCRAEQVNTFSDDAKVVLFHCLNGEGRTCVLPLTEAEETPESRELRETFKPVKAEPQKPVTPTLIMPTEHVQHNCEPSYPCMANMPTISVTPVAGIDAKPTFEELLIRERVELLKTIDEQAAIITRLDKSANDALKIADKCVFSLKVREQQVDICKAGISDIQHTLKPLLPERSHSASTVTKK